MRADGPSSAPPLTNVSQTEFIQVTAPLYVLGLHSGFGSSVWAPAFAVINAAVSRLITHQASYIPRHEAWRLVPTQHWPPQISQNALRLGAGGHVKNASYQAYHNTQIENRLGLVAFVALWRWRLPPRPRSQWTDGWDM